MTPRIGQHRNQLDESSDGIGKAVRQHNGKRVGATTALVDEVNTQSTFQFDAKIGEAIQCALLRSPVECVCQYVASSRV